MHFLWCRKRLSSTEGRPWAHHYFPKEENADGELQETLSHHQQQLWGAFKIFFFFMVIPLKLWQAKHWEYSSVYHSCTLQLYISLYQYHLWSVYYNLFIAEAHIVPLPFSKLQIALDNLSMCVCSRHHFQELSIFSLTCSAVPDFLTYLYYESNYWNAASVSISILILFYKMMCCRSSNKGGQTSLQNPTTCSRRIKRYFIYKWTFLSPQHTQPHTQDEADQETK